MPLLATRTGRLVAIGFVLTSCTPIWAEPDLGTQAVSVSNETSYTLEFMVFGAGEWRELPVSLPPGQSGAVLFGSDLVEPSLRTVDGCTEGDLVATTEGREVARHPPPLCDGDAWVISEEPNGS
jgi:hypothetical protein